MLKGNSVLVVNGQGVFSTEDRGVAHAQAGQGQGSPMLFEERLHFGSQNREAEVDLQVWPLHSIIFYSDLSEKFFHKTAVFPG